MKAIVNANIYDYHRYLTNQYILFDEKIVEIGDMQAFDKVQARIDETTDADGMLLMPGHVIGHSHIYSAFARGISLKPFAPRTFSERLKQFWWKLDKHYTLDACYHSARVCGLEYLKSGVTTVFDHHAGGHIRGSLNAIKRGLIEETGVRGILCLETSDRFDLDDCIDENVTFGKENPGDGRCRGMFGLHACLSLSDQSLGRIASKRDGLPIHTHLGESLEEELKSINLYGERSAVRLERAGLLDHDALLAHCANIDEREAQAIKNGGCTAVVNPMANVNANNGLPDIAMMMRFDIPVIIGTDSLGSSVTNEYKNAYYLMQTKLNDRTTKKFSQAHLLRIIRESFLYASRMLGANLGQIAPGYEADLILVPQNMATGMNEANAFSCLMSSVYNHFFPQYVIVGGEYKVRDYQVMFDEKEIYAKARESAELVWKRIEGEQ